MLSDQFTIRGKFLVVQRWENLCQMGNKTNLAVEATYLRFIIDPMTNAPGINKVGTFMKISYFWLLNDGIPGRLKKYLQRFSLVIM